MPAAYADEVVAEDDTPASGAQAACVKRFKTYDPRSGTSVGKGGRRIAFP